MALARTASYILGAVRGALILAAVFLISPSKRLVLGAMVASIAMYFLMWRVWPDMNYFVRSAWVIAACFLVVAILDDERFLAILIDDLYHSPKIITTVSGSTGINTCLAIFWAGAFSN